MRDILEVKELCEEKGTTVDENVLKKGIIYDAYPKYMIDIKLDYEEDLAIAKEKARKNLELKNMASSGSEDDNRE